MDPIALIDRPLAITDIETTGRDPERHEIIEIGLVLVEHRTWRVRNTAEFHIYPTRLDLAEPEALQVNGYHDRLGEWCAARGLSEALGQLASLTARANLVTYNLRFDGPFIERAFQETGIENRLRHHQFDLMTLAWFMLAPLGLTSLKLAAVSEFLGLDPEPLPHRALSGAIHAYEVMKTLAAMRLQAGGGS
ncbi:hypothetical protein AMJ57_02930 [Parcubacteria bacterium SG8_24]|nr:MAG: hypothetical protein AMJ57_02930 [Parcubacteria bacterium SG8_24]